jgi:hypothetical protein
MPNTPRCADSNNSKFAITNPFFSRGALSLLSIFWYLFICIGASLPAFRFPLARSVVVPFTMIVITIVTVMLMLMLPAPPITRVPIPSYRSCPSIVVPTVIVVA